MNRDGRIVLWPLVARAVRLCYRGFKNPGTVGLCKEHDDLVRAGTLTEIRHLVIGPVVSYDPPAGRRHCYACWVESLELPLTQGPEPA